MRDVVGIDPSLSYTGLARLRGTSQGIETHSVRSEVARSARATSDRMEGIAADVLRFALASDADVVLEGPSYASVHGKPHERGGLFWQIVQGLIRANVQTIGIVPPRSLKMYATSNGNAPKLLMLDAVQEVWPDIRNHNVADAAALAAMGADKLDGRRYLLRASEDKREQALDGARWEREGNPSS